MNNLSKFKPKNIYYNYLLTREKCSLEFFLKERSGFVEIPCPGCDGKGGILWGYMEDCDD